MFLSHRARVEYLEDGVEFGDLPPVEAEVHQGEHAEHPRAQEQHHHQEVASSGGTAKHRHLLWKRDTIRNLTHD